ncbi:MAG: hypothetical protein JO336_22825 [Acidobacteriia bacterium]|nr:hypothetical protein [Terriglobia bacterium]MBV8905916.1 hypothetical protein [Terriglobia bacterium]MBV9743077.1 hypothetical protein [Terriglobia bacterium]
MGAPCETRAYSPPAAFSPVFSPDDAIAFEVIDTCHAAAVVNLRAEF